MATAVREPGQEQAPDEMGAGRPLPGDAGGSGSPVAEQPPAVAEAPARTCRACGAAMTADQDWCLECGTARPGRLGSRPGWRAATTVSLATLMLVCGAVAASYAALTNDAGKRADTPAGANATPVAQPPAVVAPPATAPPATSVPGATTPTTTVPATTGATTLPGLPTLPTSSTPATTVTPSTTTTGSTTTTTTGTKTTTTTTKDTPPPLTAITLGTDAADIYDPYQRALDKGDPADAYDANAKDPWYVTTAADGKPMQVGLLVDLESRKTVRQIEFATKTPGFQVEVYTADGTALPSDILDTRWTHVASRSSVDEGAKNGNTKGDGKEIIALPSTVQPARKLVLWFTTPPDAGATVKLRDLVLKTTG